MANGKQSSQNLILEALQAEKERRQTINPTAAELTEESYRKYLSGEPLSPQDSTVLIKAGKLDEPPSASEATMDSLKLRTQELVTQLKEQELADKKKQPKKPSASEARKKRIDALYEKIDKLPVIGIAQLEGGGAQYQVDGKAASQELYNEYKKRRRQHIEQIESIRQEGRSEKAQAKFQRRMKATSRPDGVYEWTTPDGTKGKSVSLDNKWIKNSTVATTSEGKNVYMEEPPYNADMGLIKTESGIPNFLNFLMPVRLNFLKQNIDAFKGTLEAKTDEMKKLGMSDIKIRQEIIRMMEEAGLTLEDMGY